MKLTTVRVLATRFDDTVAFYRDVMGIPVRFDAGTYIAFDAGGFELGIYKRELMVAIVPGMPPSPDATSDSMLINLQVDDLEATITSLREKGVEFETQAHDQPDWGMRVAHLRDPEGNLVEVYDLLSPPPG